MAIKLDINVIPSYNTHILNVADASSYPMGQAINNPYIEITPPGFQTATMMFTPKALNTFNSHTLNLTQGDCTSPLPDGLYKIKYSINPNYEMYVEKSYFRLDQILEQFDNAFLKLNPSCSTTKDNQLRQKLDEIELFIQSTSSAANRCDDKLAIDLYKMALKLLKQLKC